MYHLHDPHMFTVWDLCDMQDLARVFPGRDLCDPALAYSNSITTWTLGLHDLERDLPLGSSVDPEGETTELETNGDDDDTGVSNAAAFFIV